MGGWSCQRRHPKLNRNCHKNKVLDTEQHYISRNLFACYSFYRSEEYLHVSWVWVWWNFAGETLKCTLDIFCLVEGPTCTSLQMPFGTYGVEIRDTHWFGRVLVDCLATFHMLSRSIALFLQHMTWLK